MPSAETICVNRVSIYTSYSAQVTHKTQVKTLEMYKYAFVLYLCSRSESETHAVTQDEFCQTQALPYVHCHCNHK